MSARSGTPWKADGGAGVKNVWLRGGWEVRVVEMMKKGREGA
jgi:hypothetical protein